jgi:hypothetical protein
MKSAPRTTQRNFLDMASSISGNFVRTSSEFQRLYTPLIMRAGPRLTNCANTTSTCLSLCMWMYVYVCKAALHVLYAFNTWLLRVISLQDSIFDAGIKIFDLKICWTKPSRLQSGLRSFPTTTKMAGIWSCQNSLNRRDTELGWWNVLFTIVQ